MNDATKFGVTTVIAVVTILVFAVARLPVIHSADLRIDTSASPGSPTDTAKSLASMPCGNTAR